MLPKVSKINGLRENLSTATLFENLDQVSLSFLTDPEYNYLEKKLEKEEDCTVYKHPNILFFGKIKEKKEDYLQTRSITI